MVISFTDLSHKLSFEYGADFRTFPVGSLHERQGRAEDTACSKVNGDDEWREIIYHAVGNFGGINFQLY